jgi:hypothetical protein
MGVQYSQPQDVDVKNYITTCGITNKQSKKDIYNFVTGIKSLGLWNNFICWPLRSSQNIGTGTTAYALGGMPLYTNTFNLTFVTGGGSYPTWGANGVSTNGSNYLWHADSNNPPIPASSAYTHIFIGKDANASGISDGRSYTQLLGGQLHGTGNAFEQDNFWGNGEELVIRSDPGNANQTFAFGQYYPLVVSYGSYSYMGYSAGIGSQLFTVNAANYTSTSVTFAGSAGTVGGISTSGMVLWVGLRWGSVNPALEASAILQFNIFLNQSQHTNVYNLYKSTLGQGLGLT